jgi:peptide deformylase
MNNNYVKPHQIISKEVGEKDLPRVIVDAEIMLKLCSTPVGLYTGGFAVAHQQITNKKPLRFFVMNTGDIIINPKIVQHTATTVDSQEGCLSFPDNKMIIVQRWNKCKVEYQSLENNSLSDIIIKDISGRESFVFQHEIGHFDCNYIY